MLQFCRARASRRRGIVCGRRGDCCDPDSAILVVGVVGSRNIPCRYLAVLGGVPLLVESNLQSPSMRFVKTISLVCICPPSPDGIGKWRLAGGSGRGLEWVKVGLTLEVKLGVSLPACPSSVRQHKAVNLYTTCTHALNPAIHHKTVLIVRRSTLIYSLLVNDTSASGWPDCWSRRMVPHTQRRLC